MDNYLISGINLKSKSGVGQLLKKLHSFATLNDYHTIYKPSKKKNSRTVLIKNNKFLMLFWEQLFRLSYPLRLFVYIVRLFNISNSNVLLIHPQTIGYLFFFRLIRKNKASVYIMDNSFFCIKSRNFRLTKGECLDCLGNLEQCHISCKPYPVNYTRKNNLMFLKTYLDLSSNISFYAQNFNQSKLLINHFGNIKPPTIVGMNTGEINILLSENKEPSNMNIEWTDFVYHGDINLSKGILFIIHLANELPMYSFLVPSRKEKVEEYLQKKISAQNILFREMRWETGLKEYIQKSKITICPSLWSAPIEGALIKSIANCSLVAVVKTDYGFSNEIDDSIILKLDKDPKNAALMIKKTLTRNSVYNKSEANKFLSKFIRESEHNIELIFKK
jgi:hypothetical protein